MVFRRGAASGEALRRAADLQPLQDAAQIEADMGEVVEPPRDLLPVVAAQPVKPATSRKGMAAVVAGGVAVTVGLALLVARAVLAPKKQAPFPPQRRWRRR